MRKAKRIQAKRKGFLGGCKKGAFCLNPLCAFGCIES